jgi:3-deoxy-D-manno-octulosonate 8-phosphate phosphatase (KDO 8-P phosphatase)
MIKIVISDVDGVMTDGGLVYSEDGKELKVFNVKDGLICNYLHDNKIKLGIITGRQSEVVHLRFSELKFDYILQGVKDKLKVLDSIVKEENLTYDEIAYIGDDLNDLNIIERVGISACPNDAVKLIKDSVTYVCVQNGGKGAFREFAEYVLKLNENE